MITVFTSAAPLIYGSQEVGRENKLSFFDRDPIDWNDNQEMLESYRKIFSIYNETEAFRKGDLNWFDHDDIAAFTRTYAGEEYLVIANVRNAEKVWTVDDTLTSTQWTDRMSGDSLAFGETVTLPPFGFFVLKRSD